MNETFNQIVLTAMAAAIAAIWVRLTAVQRKLEDSIRQEAICQAKLDALQKSLDAKHEENQAALAALYCRRNPE